MDNDGSRRPKRISNQKKVIRDSYINAVKNSLARQMNPLDAEKQAKNIVKEWDRQASSNSGSDIEEYESIMTKLLSRFEIKKRDPNDMVTEMREALPDIYAFRDNQHAIGENDLKLLTQLISFIQSFANEKPEIVRDKGEQISLYYERLFVPIYKTISKKTPSISSTNSGSQLSVSPGPFDNQSGVISRNPSQQHMPSSQQPIPPMQQQMPPMQQQMPPMQQQMPPMQQQMPPIQQQMPPIQQQMPPIQQQMPPIQQQMPPIQQQMPPIQQQMPPIQQQMPPMQQQMAPIQQQMPMQQMQTIPPPPPPMTQQSLTAPPQSQPHQRSSQKNPQMQKPMHAPPQAPPQMVQPANSPIPMATRTPRTHATPPQQIQQREPNPKPGPSNGGQPDVKKQIMNLFTAVRTECAVFYATPHPPHF